MSETKLLPCPFCGGHADLQYRRGNYAGTYVSCHTEDCFGNPSDDAFSFVKDEYAIAAWNTRAPSQPVQDKERAEALEAFDRAVVLNERDTVQKYKVKELDELITFHGQTIRAALEIASKVEPPVVDVEDLIIEAHHDINKKNAGQSYVKVGDISQTIRHLAASGYLRTPPLPNGLEALVKETSDYLEMSEHDVRHVLKYLYSRFLIPVQGLEKVRDALENSISVISSINASRHHLVIEDDEKFYKQTAEWAEWATEEILPEARKALSILTTHPEAAAVVDLEELKDDAAKELEWTNGEQLFLICEWLDTLAAKYPQIFKSSAQRGAE